MAMARSLKLTLTSSFLCTCGNMERKIKRKKRGRGQKRYNEAKGKKHWFCIDGAAAATAAARERQSPWSILTTVTRWISISVQLVLFFIPTLSSYPPSTPPSFFHPNDTIPERQDGPSPTPLHWRVITARCLDKKQPRATNRRRHQGS